MGGARAATCIEVKLNLVVSESISGGLHSPTATIYEMAATSWSYDEQRHCNELDSSAPVINHALVLNHALVFAMNNVTEMSSSGGAVPSTRSCVCTYPVLFIPMSEAVSNAVSQPEDISGPWRWCAGCCMPESLHGLPQAESQL